MSAGNHEKREAAAGSASAERAMVLGTSAAGVIDAVNDAVVATLGYPRAVLLGRQLTEFAAPSPTGLLEFSTADGGRLSAAAAIEPRGDGGESITAIALPPALDPEYSAKLHVLGDLAHHVVHELNQPLSVIRMAIGTARRKLGRDQEIDVAFLDSKLERVDNQCIRAAAIAETMRVFVPRNRQFRVPLEVNRAIENALTMAAPTFRKINVSVEAALGPDCRVEGNEMHLEPVLLCVLGEIHDRIAGGDDTGGATVAVATRCADGRVDIELEDSGGAPAGPLPDLEARSPLALCMRLGLARDLVRELGGVFCLEATAGGMRYRLRLPILADGAERAGGGPVP